MYLDDGISEALETLMTMGIIRKLTVNGEPYYQAVSPDEMTPEQLRDFCKLLAAIAFGC